MINNNVKVVKKQDLHLTGPFKGWNSIKSIDVYHYDVSEMFRWLWMKGTIETKRVVLVEIVFTNGTTCNDQGLHRGDDADISLQAIYQALKKYSRSAVIHRKA